MRVAAVIVAYRPEPERLAALCDALHAQGASVVVVDNGDASAGARPAVVPAHCALLAMGHNVGVAAGFNAGIRHALAHDAEVVVLFDQDSAVGPGFLDRLTQPLIDGTAAVAAPVARDRRTGEEYPSRRIDARGRAEDVCAASHAGTAPLPVDIVISSGCAVLATTYRSVGVLDETLYIDLVDVEWCLRCRAAGVRMVVVPGAELAHAIGEGQASVRLPGYRGLVHGPSRTYYQVRNPWLLLRRAHVPRRFATRLIVSALGHKAVQSVFGRAGFAHLRAGVAGLMDGIRGVSGQRGSHA